MQESTVFLSLTGYIVSLIILYHIIKGAVSSSLKKTNAFLEETNKTLKLQFQLLEITNNSIVGNGNNFVAMKSKLNIDLDNVSNKIKEVSAARDRYLKMGNSETAPHVIELYNELAELEVTKVAYENRIAMIEKRLTSSVS